MPDAPGVGEFAGAFNQGMVGGQQALLDQMRRQEIAQSVMARFGGQGAGPQAFNFMPQNPIAAQPSSANLQVPPAYQVPVQRTSDSVPPSPETQGLQIPAGLGQSMAQVPQSAAAPAVGMPPPGMGPQDVGLPQGPDPDAVARWRQLQQRNAQVAPNQAYMSLRNQGFSDQEIFGLLSGWKDLPDSVNQKLALMGQASVRPYAEGTETADFLREKELAALQEKGGIRGLGPEVAGKISNPGDYAQSMFDYGQGGPFDPRKAHATPGAGGATDVIRDSLLKRLAALAPVGPQVLNTQEWLNINHALKVLDMVDTGVPISQMSPADQAFLKANPQYRGVFVPSKKGGVPVPGAANGQQPYVAGQGGYSDELPQAPDAGLPDIPGGDTSAPAGTTPPAEKKSAPATNLAPADAPAELRAQWSRIPQPFRDKMLRIKAKVGWEQVMAAEDVKRAIADAKAASSGKKP